MNLGYRYIILFPEQCLNLSSPKASKVQAQAYSKINSSKQVILLPILSQYLTTKKLCYAEVYITLNRKVLSSSVIFER